MPKEYVPNGIRTEVWKRITSVIRDYRNIKADYEDPNVRGILRKELKRKIEAVEAAYNAADKETRELIIQRFGKQRTFRDIRLPLSSRTMQRYIRAFVVSVGQNLGEL